MTEPAPQRAPATYPAVLDDLVERGWIAPDAEGRLTLTGTGHRAPGTGHRAPGTGHAGRARVAARTEGIRPALHEGVTDAEYVTAVKVLRRITANAGGPDTL